MTTRGTHGRGGAETLLVTCGVVLACLVVMWAAAIGPSATLRGDGARDDSTTSTFQEQASDDSGEEGQPTPDEEPWSSSPWVNAIAVVAGVALLIGFLLWAAGATRERRRRRALLLDDEDRNDSILDLAPSAAVLTDHAEQQFSALREGTPRNAIVALWQELEQDVADTGLPREQWETSAEFTSRFLAELGADGRAAEELGALYREARFSAHDLTEQHRDRAHRALDALHASLRSGRR